MADIKKIMTTAVADIKAVFGVAKANIKKVGSGGTMPAADAGPFKDALRDILGGEPGIEYVFVDFPGPTAQELASYPVLGTGKCTDTGTAGADADLVSNDTTVLADSTGGFDGYFEVAGANDAVKKDMSSYLADITKSEDRTYIFVFDIQADLAACYLTFGGTSYNNNAWGWLYHNVEGGASGVISSQYLWNVGGSTYWTIHGLTTANATHSAGGTETNCVTTAVSAGVPRRTVLWISYDHGATTATIRWKQTGDGAGHMYITNSTGTDTTITSATSWFWGFWGGSSHPTNTRIKYVAVADANLTLANFDTLADIALGN